MYNGLAVPSTLGIWRWKRPHLRLGRAANCVLHICTRSFWLFSYFLYLMIAFNLLSSGIIVIRQPSGGLSPNPCYYYYRKCSWIQTRGTPRTPLCLGQDSPLLLAPLPEIAAGLEAPEGSRRRLLLLLRCLLMCGPVDSRLVHFGTLSAARKRHRAASVMVAAVGPKCRQIRDAVVNQWNKVSF